MYGRQPGEYDSRQVAVRYGTLRTAPPLCAGDIMPISKVSEPREEAPKVPFLRRVTDANDAYEGVALADEIWWCYTHFNLTLYRTFACKSFRDDDGKILDDAECEDCKKERPARQRGYLHVWCQKARREEFLEITPDCWRICKIHWPVIPALRGWRVSAVRNKGKTGVLSVYFKEPLTNASMQTLPCAKTPEAALMHVMK
jgi:hypothetical protein